MNNSDILLKREIKDLMNIPGDVKGEWFNSFKSYIIKRHGEEGIEIVFARIKELGCFFDFKNIEAFKFYPEHFRVIFILVSKEVFNWTNEDVIDVGYSSLKVSFAIRVLLSHLVSVKELYKRSSLFWGKYYNFGKLETVELNEEKKYAVIRVIDYYMHPIICLVFIGFFKGIIELCLKKESKVNVEEVKCAHKGDEYHEYFIKWEQVVS